MRDLCLSKGKEISFLDIYNQQYPIGNSRIAHSLNTDTYGRLRRYAINLNSNGYSRRYDFHSNSSADYALRTLLAIFPRGSTRVPLNYKNFKLLRVLDLENNEPLDENITKKVFSLIHLRYVRIRSVSTISSSVGNLRNLEFLNLGTDGLLPETASKLVQLRHLILRRSPVAQYFKIDNLVNLQTVAIAAGNWIRKGCLEKLLHIRELDVWQTSRLQTDTILAEIVAKQSSIQSSSSNYQYQNPIRTLSINTIDEIPNSIFDSLSCCHNLHRLDLTGSKLDVVNLQNYPQNLTKLYLKKILFTENTMTSLQYLPKLKILDFINCVYERVEMVFYSDGFPQLQHLDLNCLRNVSEQSTKVECLVLKSYVCVAALI